MKVGLEIMEILAAYDLTGTLRAAAELTGCSHHTVARHVAARDAGQPIAEPAYRGRVTDPFLPKIEEWIEASHGKLRADKAHVKLQALGYAGSERSTRRAMAQVRANYLFSNVRVHRPWVTGPGQWLLCRVLHKSQSSDKNMGSLAITGMPANTLSTMTPGKPSPSQVEGNRTQA
jgi:hypothetical protein